MRTCKQARQYNFLMTFRACMVPKESRDMHSHLRPHLSWSKSPRFSCSMRRCPKTAWHAPAFAEDQDSKHHQVEEEEVLP